MTVPTSRLGRVSLALLLATVAAGLLASVAMPPAEAAFPGANGTIVFASERTSGKGVTNPTGDFELFTMNPDGSGLFQLTDNTAMDEFDPAWSADGQWLTYVSYQGGTGEIFMRKAGSVVPITRRLTTNTANDFEPTFSPDGSKIAFVSTRDGNNEIYVMSTTDNNTDGNGDNPVNLTNDPAPDSQPAWSPDGTKIAFRSDRGKDGAGEIYVMDADGSNPVNLTDIAGFDVAPAWSPNGTRIAFSSNREGKGTQIWIMSADGSGPKRLTKGAAGNEDPAWSPDGTKIAFQSTQGGSGAEIYVMKAKPESKKNRPKALTKNDVGDVQPDWRPIP